MCKSDEEMEGKMEQLVMKIYIALFIIWVVSMALIDIYVSRK